MTELHLQDFQGFSCTSCGLCCTRPWGVEIAPEVEQEIRGSLLFGDLQRHGYTPIILAEDREASLAQRKQDGSCVFLEPGHLCGLHRELGEQSKPIGCQLYPYRAVRTPTGTYFSQSWVCPPVVAGLDRNLEENRLQLSQMLLRFPQSAADLPDEALPVKLTSGLRISWKSYLALERRLLESFDEERPAESLLILTTNLLRVAQAGGADGEVWPTLAQWPEDTSFERALLRMYLAGVIAVLETQHHQEMREDVRRCFDEGQPFFSKQLKMLLPPLNLEAPQPPVLREAFFRYFLNHLVGKNLLSPSVARGLLTLAASHALLAYFGEAFRLERSESELTLESLTKAFEIVESELFHSDLLAPFFAEFESTILSLTVAS